MNAFEQFLDYVLISIVVFSFIGLQILLIAWALALHKLKTERKQNEKRVEK